MQTPPSSGSCSGPLSTTPQRAGRTCQAPVPASRPCATGCTARWGGSWTGWPHPSVSPSSLTTSTPQTRRSAGGSSTSRTTPNCTASSSSDSGAVLGHRRSRRPCASRCRHSTKLLWRRWSVLTGPGGCGNGRAGTRCCSRNSPPQPTTSVPLPLRALVARRLATRTSPRPRCVSAAVLGTASTSTCSRGVVERVPCRGARPARPGVRQALLVEDAGRAAVPARAGPARGRSRDQRCPAGLAAPARRRGAARRGRTPHPLELARHARDGRRPGRGAEGLRARRRPRPAAGSTWPGPKRLLDEAIALQDSGDAAAPAQPGPDVPRRPGRCRRGRRGGDGHRRDRRRRWSCARGRPATGTTSTARSGSAGPAAGARHRPDDPGQQPDRGRLRPPRQRRPARGRGGAREAAGRAGRAGAAGVDRRAAGPPGPARRGLATLEPMLGAEARRGAQGFWVEHTLQMTAHAYGLLGRSADALRCWSAWSARSSGAGPAVRYAGVQHTYRSWILRNLGDPAAEELALTGLEAGRVPGDPRPVPPRRRRLPAPRR